MAALESCVLERFLLRQQSNPLRGRPDAGRCPIIMVLCALKSAFSAIARFFGDVSVTAGEWRIRRGAANHVFGLIVLR